MKQVLSYMKKYKSSVIAAMILTVFNNGTQLLLPAMMSLIINNGIARSNTAEGVEYIKKIGFYMIIVSAFALIIGIISSYFSSKATTGYAKELRRAIFVKVESLSQCDLDKISTSSLITRSTNDVRQIENMVLTCMRMLLSSLIMLIGGTIMAFLLNKKLAGALFSVVPIILFIAWLVAKKIVPMYDIVQKYTDKLNQVLREKVGGIRVIRAFNKLKYEDDRFKDSNDNLTGIMLRINRIYALLIPLGMLVLITILVSLVFLSSKQIVTASVVTEAGRIALQNTVGNLQAFIIYVLLIIASITLAASMYVFIPKAMISVNRIKEIFDIESEIKSAENPVDGNNEGRVTFDNVSFKYPGAEENVLSNISFSANPGEFTAIIGSTGGGKSTLVNLIPRFFDATEGNVLIDGVNVKDMDETVLRRKLAFIPQKAVLFSGSVADNLRFGNENATDEELERALEIAQAKDFVHSLPEGLNSFISQGGKNLSGGQKQRLAIARAIANNSEIFIFDDSFSALDFKTDSLLRKSIRENIKNATVIIVAQRIGTILDADKIVVLKDGEVAGIGRHKELAESCEEYINIMKSQLSQEDFT